LSSALEILASIEKKQCKYNCQPTKVLCLDKTKYCFVSLLMVFISYEIILPTILIAIMYLCKWQFYVCNQNQVTDPLITDVFHSLIHLVHVELDMMLHLHISIYCLN
jgi:hypothetical protein